MPLNWKDEPIPSKADKATDMLGFKEIGGVGQLIYHPFRFKDYRLGDDRGDYCAFPICRPGYEPEFPNEDVITGKGLLVSLCNLAHQINSYDNSIPYDRLIVKWCLENMHPYSVDFIYSELNENFDINTFDAEMVEKDGIFEINQFLHDLGKLYNAVMYYVALEGVCIGDGEVAYDLSQEGKFFEGYSFFEKYKASVDKKKDMIPVLRMSNVVNGELDFSELKYLPEKCAVTKKEPRKWLLQEGDFLVTRTNGSKDLVGKSAVFHNSEKYTYASYLIRYRFDTTLVLPDYINILFMTPLVREQIAVMRRQGGGQYNLNSDEIGAIRIPVPSLPEQQSIIDFFNKTKDGSNKFYKKAHELKLKAASDFEKEIFS